MTIETSTLEVVKIPLSLLVPNPNRPRTRFDETDIERLAESIRDQGLISPIVVSRNGGGYSIVAGERRYRACKKLGWEHIEAIVTQGDPEAIALIENLLRVDLHPLEEAQAYASMIERKKYRHVDIARIDLDERIRHEATTTYTEVPKSMLIEIAQVPQEEQYALWKKARSGANIRDVRKLVRALESKPKLPGVLRAGRSFLKQLSALPEAEVPVGGSDVYKLLQLLDEIGIKARKIQGRNG